MALEVTAHAGGPIALDASFRVERRELLALVGPSGAGKTTLLRTIAGLWRPANATVRIDGETWLDTAAGIDVPPHRRHAGLVFQSYALFPHMTAVQNVMAAMPAGTPGARDEAVRLLALVNLPDLGNRKPAGLSGGQQQRVALARALARKPRVLLLDEPFSAVDRPTRERLHGELVGLRRHLAMPVVLVTHDINEAQLLADRLLVIDGGMAIAQGPVAEVMSDPAALRALGLREMAAMLPARIEAHEADGLTRLVTAAGPIWLPRLAGEPGNPVRVRVLAHEVILSNRRPQGLSAQNILPVTVSRIVPGDGPGVIVHLGLGEGELLARITQRAATGLKLAPGKPVFAIVKSMSVARDHVAGGSPA